MKVPTSDMIVHMGIDSEKNLRRILVAGVLFATVGILALVITLMQPSVQDEKQRLAQKIFDEDISPEKKQEVLAALSASSTGKEMSEEEKFRVLESLQSQ